MPSFTVSPKMNRDGSTRSSPIADSDVQDLRGAQIDLRFVVVFSHAFARRPAGRRALHLSPALDLQRGSRFRASRMPRSSIAGVFTLPRCSSGYPHVPVLLELQDEPLLAMTTRGAAMAAAQCEPCSSGH